MRTARRPRCLAVPLLTSGGGTERPGASLSGKTQMSEGTVVPRARSVPNMNVTRMGLFCSRDSLCPCLSVTSQVLAHLCKVQRRWPGSPDTRALALLPLKWPYDLEKSLKISEPGVPPLSHEVIEIIGPHGSKFSELGQTLVSFPQFLRPQGEAKERQSPVC